MRDTALAKLIAPNGGMYGCAGPYLRGLRGLYQGQRIQILWAAGSFFCNLMLMVSFILASSWTTERMSLVFSTGQGALGGACLGLYTSEDGSLIRIVGFILLGAVVGAFVYFRHHMMYSAWRD
ncbi:hypothetical protein WEU32_04375 [Brevundimonas sp. BH3]|uniref:hypothetical protein n=1 Tax=Brevundimonas sp. BH3 TaxID=3133089 RepID=UPI00324FC54B